MNVLMLSREYPPHIYGGAGVVVDELSRALARLARVEVRCFGDQRAAGPPLGVQGYAPTAEIGRAAAAFPAPAGPRGAGGGSGHGLRSRRGRRRA
jgi:hypothetical protein